MKMRTLGLFVVASLVVAACGAEGGGETTTVPTEATTTTATAGQEDDPTTTTAPPQEETTTTAAEDMTTGVHVANTDLGSILVDPDGFTLYIFTVDDEGESACYDSCAELWPPVPAETAISAELDASMFGSTERTDGPDQLTVNGMPLYLYTPDTSPGDVLGQGFNDVWFVVDADGNMVTSAEASSDGSSGPADDDYDYGYGP
jgi:predicted lipoprotein with Yx(FWY)xxD motif